MYQGLIFDSDFLLTATIGVLGFWGSGPRNGVPGGVQNTCPIRARFRAMLETAEGVPCRFGNFYQIFSLLMLLVLRNNIPALNDESHH